MKILLVGNKRSGKTSWLKSVTGEEYSSSYKPSELSENSGIVWKDWYIDVTEVSGKMSNSFEIYLTKDIVSVFVFVDVQCDKVIKIAEDYISRIRSLFPKMIIQVIGTKSDIKDDCAEDIIRKKLEDEFVVYSELSSFLDRNIYCPLDILAQRIKIPERKISSIKRFMCYKPKLSQSYLRKKYSYDHPYDLDDQGFVKVIIEN